MLPPHWPPDWPPVALTDAAVKQALAQANPAGKPLSRDALEQQRHVLTDTLRLLDLASKQASKQPKRKRTDLFQLVLDTVWWRRLAYFVWLAFVVIAVAYPFVAPYLRIEGVTNVLNARQGGPVGWTLGLIKPFLPGFAESWLNAVVRNSAGAVFVLIGLYVSLRFSAVLQQRICDRARAAWSVGERLRPTGQRLALAWATLAFIFLAIGAWALSTPPWEWAISHAPLFWFSAAGAVGFFFWWASRMYRGPAPSVDPEKPGFFLGFARIMQTNKWAVCGYRFLAQKIAPAGFLALSGILAVSLAHRAVFDLLSTNGEYCKATLKGGDDEILLPGKKFETRFETSSKCDATGLRLIAGRKYRIRLDMDEGVQEGPKREHEGDWFDKGIRTDVGGFTADSMRHYMASPLKRWWWQNWFQPIARIGEVGNYEHVLQSAAPLPVVRFEGCQPPAEKRLSWWEAIKDTSSPATPDFRKAQLECEPGKGILPNRVLISDITADATGELFLYVNDAVWAFPGRPTDFFYQNNSGSAKVTVTRILADVVE